jgi:tartrate dehydrogenase/decarboxylase/D-malate dehydrogenase
MMPDDWMERIGDVDAIFFGAVGWPGKVPDHISLWGSLIQFRRAYDLYVNLRPVRLIPGVPSPLAGRKPGDIDMLIVRENTEGEYSDVEGISFPGTARELVIQETVMTRFGTDRILRYAFELAQQRPKKHLTSATKSNGIAITMPWWDSRVAAMANNYPSIRTDQYHIDILTAQFVMNPDRFDVVAASNLFGDILSDLGPACTGTIGIAPCGNINPDRSVPSVFELFRTAPCRASLLGFRRSGDRPSVRRKRKARSAGEVRVRWSRSRPRMQRPSCSGRAAVCSVRR